MCFKLRPLGKGDGDRWQWSVYSYPDLAILRDGQIVGDRDKAERAARAAVASLSGTVRLPLSDDGVSHAMDNSQTGMDGP